VRQHHHVAALHAGDGVAVGGRSRDVVEAKHAARARPVLDDHLLPEALAHLRRDEARHDVGGIPWRKGNDDAHRLGRVALRVRKRREQQEGDDLQHACS